MKKTIMCLLALLFSSSAIADVCVVKLYLYTAEGKCTNTANYTVSCSKGLVERKSYSPKNVENCSFAGDEELAILLGRLTAEKKMSVQSCQSSQEHLAYNATCILQD